MTISPEQYERSETNWQRRKEIEATIKRALEDAHRMLNCCPNCWHFDAKLEECKLANARPPAQVIAFGCEKFDFDIPF